MDISADDLAGALKAWLELHRESRHPRSEGLPLLTWAESTDELLDVVLGVMIWRSLPWSGLEIIGLLVGISTLFRGVSWVMLGFALRRIPKPAA